MKWEWDFDLTTFFIAVLFWKLRKGLVLERMGDGKEGDHSHKDEESQKKRQHYCYYVETERKKISDMQYISLQVIIFKREQDFSIKKKGNKFDTDK